MLHERLKKLMEDIIDVAYSNSDIPEAKKKQFKWFKLYVLPKESQTSSGRYIIDTHTIEIYNARLGGEHMAKCCLHELAHHIDWCLHGTSGHKDPFFAEYAKLIYASLDMGILEIENFDDEWSKDYEKVQEILGKYCHHEVCYQKEMPCIVKVYNSYSIKNQLKERGYFWNNIEAVWEKETDDTSEEEVFLESLGAVFPSISEDKPKSPWYSIEETSMVLDPTVYIEAKDWGVRTYDVRHILKKNGFFFDGNQKKWLLKVKSEDFNQRMEELKTNNELKGIEFVSQNRKIKKPKKK